MDRQLTFQLPAHPLEFHTTSALTVGPSTTSGYASRSADLSRHNHTPFGPPASHDHVRVWLVPTQSHELWTLYVVTQGQLEPRSMLNLWDAGVQSPGLSLSYLTLGNRATPIPYNILQ